MKRTRWALILLSLLLWLVAGVQAGENEGITLWGASADNADSLLGLRAGYQFDWLAEIGCAVKWTESGPSWGPEPRIYGGYGIMHLNDLLGFYEPSPASNQWQEFLQSLVARPFFGLEILYDDIESVIRPNYIVGTLFTLAEDEEFKVALSVEYNTGDVMSLEESAVLLGLRIKF